MAIITIFGLAGTGKSLCSKMLAKRLDYEILSTGSIVRSSAKDLGMSLHDYQILLNKDPKLDIEFDKKIKKVGQERDNLVVDSWLAWHFIPHSIKIKLYCDEDVRLKRISHRDQMNLDEVKRQTLYRESTKIERYKNLYKINDYTADNHFDLIIDTSRQNPKKIVKTILKEVSDKLTLKKA